MDKVDKFKDIIDLIKLEMSKSNPQTNELESKEAEIVEWVTKLGETVCDFIQYTEKIQTDKRQIDQEILRLLETTQRLPNLLKAKKLLGLYQTMVLGIYKVCTQREIKLCVDIEDAVAVNLSGNSGDDGFKRIKQELASFLSNSENHLEDKMRLLLIGKVIYFIISALGFNQEVLG